MDESLVSAIDQFVINRVKEMRIERGLSQFELANLLDWSKGFIGDVEGNKRYTKYNLTHINQLAIVFKCSPRDFLPEEPIF